MNRSSVRYRFPYLWTRGGAVLCLLGLLGCSSAGASPRTDVTIEGDRWLINGQPVNAGSMAEGLLMNVRMINATFEDTGPAAAEHLPADFDPEANTDRFIERIPEYRDHGVNAFTVGLQGGFPGYEGAVNSAFEADGTLRDAYIERAARIIEAADRHGVVIILSYFYQRQHSHERALTGRKAVLNAVENATRWIADRGYTNVLVEISNEHAHGGFRRWNDGEWMRSREGMVEMIAVARSVAPHLLMSTSTTAAREIVEVSDYVLLHLNGTSLEGIPEMLEAGLVYGKPVVVNEDDKLGYEGAEAARLSVEHEAGWGFMNSPANQRVPFEFEGAADDPVVYDMMRRLTTPGARVEPVALDELHALITDPYDGHVARAGSTLPVTAAVTGARSSEVHEAVFYTGGTFYGHIIGRSSSAPWRTEWADIPAGSHDLVVVLNDESGRELARSRVVDIEVVSQ